MKNLAGIMQQAEKMQKKIAELESEINSSVFEGSAGGNLVTVNIKGDGSIVSIDMDNSLFKEEEKGVLSDLIAAAYNDAKRKCDTKRTEKMKEITGSLALPPGFGNLGF